MKNKSVEKLSEIKFLLYQAKNRIIIWSCMITVFSLLSILSICFGLIDLPSFFPAFLLLGVYVTLLVIDIQKYRSFCKQKKEFICKGIEGMGKLETFLSGNATTKLIQGHDVSITDQFGNYLVFFRMENEWLLEIQFINEALPTYQSFSFDDYPKNTSWLAKGGDKKPKWFGVVERVQSKSEAIIQQ